jgi:norsolorinic acid ketoreductase
MAQAVAEQIGTKLEDLGAISPEASAAGVLAVVDAATKESHGGKFWNYDGSALTY